jgi:hypothetical protein
MKNPIIRVVNQMKKAIWLIAPLIIAVLASLAVMPSVRSDSIPVNVTVSSYFTATFQYAYVAYGTLAAGTSNQAAPLQSSGIYNVTISTNAPYKVQASGTDFDDGSGHTFYIGNLTMDTNQTAGSLSQGSGLALTGASQTIDTNIDSANTVSYNGLWLSIPATQYANPYTSSVTVTYSNV